MRYVVTLHVASCGSSSLRVWLWLLPRPEREDFFGIVSGFVLVEAGCRTAWLKHTFIAEPL